MSQTDQPPEVSNLNLRAGETTLGGRVPVNPSGGLACFGEAVPAVAYEGRIPASADADVAHGRVVDDLCTPQCLEPGSGQRGKRRPADTAAST